MMKKIASLMLMALFVISIIPLGVLAEEGEDSSSVEDEDTIRSKFEKHQDRFEKFMEKIEDREEKLDEEVRNLKDSGIDIPNFEIRVRLFKDNVESAKENFNTAIELFKLAEEIRENDPDKNRLKEARELYNYARQYFKEAVQDVRQAVRLYKQVVQDIRKAGGLNWDENAPEFTPGEDLGFYVWRDKSRTYVCASGDGSNHEYKGRISAKNMKQVYTYWFDSRDEYRFEGNELTFSGQVNPHYDCIGFRSGGQVEMELHMDGEDSPQVIHLGKELEQPESHTFVFPQTLRKRALNVDTTTPSEVEVEESA